MDRIQYYESLLTINEKKMDSEVFWDGKAEDFYYKQNTRTDEILTKVMEHLLDYGYLHAGVTVLDIGGGSGRFAIPMAKEAKSVTITDISTNMLKNAKDNAQNNGVTNIEYAKLDLRTADFQEIGWQGKYDLVFANMCPAIRSAAALDKMTSASRDKCIIGQFIEKEDNIADAIKEILNISHHPDPHKGRDLAYAYFNILWLKGYNPHIKYFAEDITSELTLAETIANYEAKYSDKAKEENLDLEEFISGFMINDKITVKKKSTLALISWESNKIK